LVKKYLESKKYGVRRLINEFPNKKWSMRGVEKFLKRLRTTVSFERAPGSGLPRTMSGGVVCRPVSTLKADFFILNITYMIATLKITMSKWQHCKLLIGDDFFCSLLL